MSRYFIVFHVQVARTDALVETRLFRSAHPRSLTASRNHVDALFRARPAVSLGACLSDERRRPVRRGRPRRHSRVAVRLDPPTRPPAPTGGVFGYWFGPPRPRADTSAVFTELVHRIRAGRYKLTPQETAVLRRCESDLQVRAITSGYVAGAVTARRPRRRPSARRAPMGRGSLRGDRRRVRGGADHRTRVSTRTRPSSGQSTRGECRAIVARLAPRRSAGRTPRGDARETGDDVEAKRDESTRGDARE